MGYCGNEEENVLLKLLKAKNESGNQGRNLETYLMNFCRTFVMIFAE